MVFDFQGINIVLTTYPSWDDDPFIPSLQVIRGGSERSSEVDLTYNVPLGSPRIVMNLGKLLSNS